MAVFGKYANLAIFVFGILKTSDEGVALFDMLLGKKSIGANTATLVPFEKQMSKRQRNIDNSTVTLAQKTENKSTLQYWKNKYSANKQYNSWKAENTS